MIKVGDKVSVNGQELTVIFAPIITENDGESQGPITAQDKDGNVTITTVEHLDS